MRIFGINLPSKALYPLTLVRIPSRFGNSCDPLRFNSLSSLSSLSSGIGYITNMRSWTLIVKSSDSRPRFFALNHHDEPYRSRFYTSLKIQCIFENSGQRLPSYANFLFDFNGSGTYEAASGKSSFQVLTSRLEKIVWMVAASYLTSVRRWTNSSASSMR